MNYEKLSVRQFLHENRSGNIDTADFYSKLFEKLKILDKRYNLFITLAEKEAKTQKKQKGTLGGLPVSVKDCICTKGIQSTAGSKILEGYIPPFDATSVQRVKEQGGVIIGKTCQDELGFGTFSTNCAYKIPKNPHDPSRSCGGSSGGSGGLTAALDFPHISLAESTGGSISCPASFTGTVGLTPTYGLVSRYGLIDYANSLDKIGPIGKSVEDVALMLSIIAGHDEKDSTSLQKKTPDYTKHSKEIKGVKIAVPKEYFGGIDAQVEKVVWSAIKKLEALGAKINEISLPMTKYALATYYIIATSEASTNLAKYCGMRYGSHPKLEGTFNEYFSKTRSKGFGKEAKRRIILGTYARMAGYRDQYYLKAMKVRTLVIQDFKKAFKGCDVIISPTMPIIAPKFKEIEKLSPIENYAMDVLTVAPNLAGIPHLSVPCGTVSKMPVGIHILGDHLQEEKILRVGHALEKVKK